LKIESWAHSLRLILLISLVIGLILLLKQLVNSPLATPHPGDDFIEYWAAAHLHVKGGNPYDPLELLETQRLAGWSKDEALIMYNPPWILTLLLPLGFIEYGYGRLLWLFISFIIVSFASDWSWRFYGGDPQRRWIGWLVGFAFLPVLIALRGGQINPFILLGLIGFLLFVHQRKWFLAGVACILISLKPQLLHLFWLALFFWLIQAKQWRLMLGVMGAIFLTLTTALVMNPNIIEQFLVLMVNYSPRIWVTPTLGAVLRLSFGVEYFWLQFLPALFSVPWVFYYWKQYRQNWDWGNQLPIILLVSLFTTSYGWLSDQIILLPVVIQVTIWLSTNFYEQRLKAIVVLVAFVTFSGIILFFNIIRMSEFAYVWLPASWLLLYLFARRNLRDSITTFENNIMSKNRPQINAD
jgi:hypothetical protein